VIDVVIDQVRDHRDQVRDLGAIEGIMMHRCGVNLKSGVVLGYDAQAICDAFLGRDPKWAEVSTATGRQNAYTFFVGGNLGPAQFDGRTWQTLDLDEVGHHGLRFSYTHLGVTAIGDFRVKPPSELQWQATIKLVTELCLLLGVPSRRVVGHGEVPHAHRGGKAPGEPGACPGDFRSMDAFRAQVRGRMLMLARNDARHRLEVLGARLPMLS
jgi:hypothetical protein